jgi:polysaccharide chain length determinant protein (PEP-CTERM system associated)
MIWKHRYLVLMIWAVLAGLGAGIVYKLPAIYKAETLILVESQRIPERFVAPTVNMDLKDRLTTLSQQILSYRKLLDIIEKFDLYKEERKNHAQEEVVEMMKEDVSVQLEEGWATRSRAETRPSAFRIAYQGTNSEVVALVANQLGNLFIDENLRSREVQAVGTSEFLGTQLAEAKKHLEEQEGRMSAYKLKHNGELPEQENALIAALGQAQVQLQSANEAVYRAEQTRQMADAALTSAEASGSAISQLAEELNAPAPSEKAQAAMTRSERLQRQLDQILIQYKEDYPEARALRKLVALARQQEEQEALRQADANRTGEDESATSDEVPTRPANRASLQLSETLIRQHERTDGLKAQQQLAARQIEQAKVERERLVRRIDEMEKRIAQLPIREQELAVVKRDYEISKANYQSLLDKGMSADMAADMERRQKAERFTVIDSARVPQKPVKPNRPLWYAIAGSGGLLLGLTLALAREIQGNVFLGEWELPKGVPILGRVPRIQPLGDADVAQRRRRRMRLAIGLSLLALLIVGAVFGAVYLGWIHLPEVFQHA